MSEKRFNDPLTKAEMRELRKEFIEEIRKLEARIDRLDAKAAIVLRLLRLV